MTRRYIPRAERERIRRQNVQVYIGLVMAWFAGMAPLIAAYLF